jgi:hypothetical protein
LQDLPTIQRRFGADQAQTSRQPPAERFTAVNPRVEPRLIEQLRDERLFLDGKLRLISDGSGDVTRAGRRREVDHPRRALGAAGACEHHVPEPCAATR